MSHVRVAGSGLTAFGNTPERTSRDLFAEATVEAFEDSGVPRADVDAVFYGNFMGELSEHQGHQGPLMAEAAGVQAPATRYESACASSGTAVRDAVVRLRNGEADVVLVGGAERMTNLGTAGATEALAIAADDLWEVRAGTTFPGAYALMAQAYFDRFGGKREDLAHVAVKNHDNALSNEKAQYQSAIEVDDVLEAPTVSTPLGLYDSCPLSDGAAALVLTSESYAEEHDLEAPISITGTGQGGDRMALHDRDHLARSPAAREAGKEAYADAGIDADDIDLAEVHDCFTIAEVLALEALDLEQAGEGISAARDGRTTADGETPVNLSGGLKAKGHPVGATGASQIAEVTKLLAGDHPNSAHVPDATTGVAHNAGGTVASATVHVLEEVSDR
ncbi:thiolase C-terminal domain-containing protein [Natronobacterium gregoryi]|uniref:3-ketoacyl-CoA thiolase n=2 Tax=Natronobacterium gregoryi TaxID=44930 RepID=L0AF59_NATGS|nr:beta-ketoacyl synthase N-terminal-like domain-containing protein [Natronobacterium gregoryi]AFZ72064.1 acetyl-CoA acetyltransferase [Natronobacterium gregoryi SP2]ELY62763.1 3-ketoacyl-CoA thiolase [Natronobacterium gregoryi SP2]PLK20038.1 3-ketoacyl-CoA thiolase [Natronobacterium gregoryi SP2]SFJ44629.1 acetyl-CoA C-acetyltransferase [Natronobacterium gregoryi]